MQSLAAENAKTAINVIKNIPFLPTLPEFFTFLVMFILLFLLFLLFHNNAIQTAVRKTSRCMRAREVGRAQGQYVVKAMNKDNNDLYNIGYDLTTKEVTMNCGCPEGKIANTFRDVPIYSLSTETPQTIKEKSCACDKTYYTAGDQIYYGGYPGLVSFMNSDGRDLSFFDTIQGV